MSIKTFTANSETKPEEIYKNLIDGAEVSMSISRFTPFALYLQDIDEDMHLLVVVCGERMTLVKG